MTDTAARIAAGIAERIWTGELQPGARLPPERTLAPELGTSRPTLRAAIRKLERALLVQIGRGRAGAAVVCAAVVPPDLLVQAIEPPRSDVRGLLEARRALEPAVAWLAAERATPRDVAALSGLAQALREAPAAWEVHVLLDSRFHLQIARAAHNDIVWDLMKRLHVQLYCARHRELRTPHDQELLASIHERTLEALLSRDRERIERDLADHLGWLERPAPLRWPPANRSAAGAAGPGPAASRHGPP
jgi:GntR family transcriptional repressor for pyruvate dehydrogenase complex